jgi:hypothetical protein
MSISSMIREEVRYLAYSGEDINVRKLARKYNCSPSLVVKNIYKVEKEENFKHLTKYGVKGKVNLLIIDFENDYKEDGDINKNSTKIINNSKSFKKKNEKFYSQNNDSSSDNQTIIEKIDDFSPSLNTPQNSFSQKENYHQRDSSSQYLKQFNSQEKNCLPT